VTVKAGVACYFSNKFSYCEWNWNGAKWETEVGKTRALFLAVSIKIETVQCAQRAPLYGRYAWKIEPSNSDVKARNVSVLNTSVEAGVLRTSQLVAWWWVIARPHCLHVDILHVEFCLSPQCGHNVLHVSCIQKLNMYRRHVACIRNRKSTSFYIYSEVEHVQLSDTCKNFYTLLSTT